MGRHIALQRATYHEYNIDDSKPSLPKEVRYMSILLSKFSLNTREPTDGSPRPTVENQIFLALA